MTHLTELIQELATRWNHDRELEGRPPLTDEEFQRRLEEVLLSMVDKPTRSGYVLRNCGEEHGRAKFRIEKLN